MMNAFERSSLDQWKEISARVAETKSRPKVLSENFLPDGSSIKIRTDIEAELKNENNSRVGIISVTNESLNFYRFVDSKMEILKFDSIPSDLDYIFFCGSAGYAELFLPRDDGEDLIISPHYIPLGANSEATFAEKIYDREAILEAINELNETSPELKAEISQINGLNKLERIKKALFLKNLAEFESLLTITEKSFPQGKVFIQMKDDFRRYWERRIINLGLTEQDFVAIKNGIGETIISVMPVSTAIKVFKIDKS